MARGIQQTVSCGGADVDVVVAPRPPAGAAPAQAWRGIRSLLTGMRVTLSYLLRPSTVVTQQYPENRATLKMFDRYRSRLRLIEDSGRHRCPGCKICEKACPNATITINARKGAVTGKTELEQFIWRMDSCTFCNACVQACPFDAIEWTQDFENAVFDKRLLVYNLNDYKGPPIKVLKDAEPDKLAAMVTPLARYEGPTPMGGTTLPGSPALTPASGPGRTGP